MSLLNEMLRDLHQRRALSAGVDAGVMSGVATADENDAPHQPRFSWQWVVLATFAVAAAVAGYAAAPHLTGSSPPAWTETAIGAKAGSALLDQPPGRLPRGAGHPRTGFASRPVSLRMGASLQSLAAPPRQALKDLSSGVVRDSQETGPASVQIFDAQLVQSANEVVMVLELERAAEFRVFALARPPRLILDVLQAAGSVPTRGMVQGQGPVQRVRSLSYGEDLRLVLDLAKPVSIRRSALEENGGRGHRLILELVPAEPEPVVIRERAGTESDSSPLALEQVPGPDAGALEAPLAGTMTKTAVNVDRHDLAQAQYRRASQLLRVGRGASGEALLREALAADPTHGKAREMLASRLLTQRRYRQAGPVLLQGLALRPTDVRLHSLYARLLVERGEPEQAIAVLNRVSPSLADEPEYHAFQAALLHKTGRHRQAAERYRALLQLRPQAGVWWMGLAMALEAGGEPASALGAYTKAGSQPDMPPSLLRFVKQRIQHLQEQAS